MSELETTGRTVEEAVEKALTTLGIKKTNAIIEVLDTPSHGLLGIIGTKDAKVRVRMNLQPSAFLGEYIEKLLSEMKIEGRVAVTEDDEKIEASIRGSDVGALIGRRGRTLSDLQYLLNIIVRRQFTALQKMVVVDVENYRSRREKTLTQLAESVARKVSRDGYELALEPMTPQERRIIHLALQEYPGVETHSAGEEPYRKVIIAPK